MTQVRIHLIYLYKCLVNDNLDRFKVLLLGNSRVCTGQFGSKFIRKNLNVHVVGTRQNGQETGPGGLTGETTRQALRNRKGMEWILIGDWWFEIDLELLLSDKGEEMARELNQLAIEIQSWYNPNADIGVAKQRKMELRQAGNWVFEVNGEDHLDNWEEIAQELDRIFTDHDCDDSDRDDSDRDYSDQDDSDQDDSARDVPYLSYLQGIGTASIPLSVPMEQHRNIWS